MYHHYNSLQKVVRGDETQHHQVSYYTLSHLENDRDVISTYQQVDICHRARNLCGFSRVQKGTSGLAHKGCILQRVSLGTLSDVTVVLGMRQSIYNIYCKAEIFAVVYFRAFRAPTWMRENKSTQICSFCA